MVIFPCSWPKHTSDVVKWSSRGGGKFLQMQFVQAILCKLQCKSSLVSLNYTRHLLICKCSQAFFVNATNWDEADLQNSHSVQQWCSEVSLLSAQQVIGDSTDREMCPASAQTHSRSVRETSHTIILNKFQQDYPHIVLYPCSIYWSVASL